MLLVPMSDENRKLRNSHALQVEQLHWFLFHSDKLVHVGVSCSAHWKNRFDLRTQHQKPGAGALPDFKVVFDELVVATIARWKIVTTRYRQLQFFVLNSFQIHGSTDHSHAQI